MKSGKRSLDLAVGIMLKLKFVSANGRSEHLHCELCIDNCQLIQLCIDNPATLCYNSVISLIVLNFVLLRTAFIQLQGAQLRLGTVRERNY